MIDNTEKMILLEIIALFYLEARHSLLVNQAWAWHVFLLRYDSIMNRLNCINNKIDYQWLKKSIDSFKIQWKLTFLT